MLSGSSLVSEQMQELNRRLSSDAAGLQELDATCRTCGIPSPNNDHRLAALQMIWPVQVRVLIWLTPVSLTLPIARQNRTHARFLSCVPSQEGSAFPGLAAPLANAFTCGG